MPYPDKPVTVPVRKKPPKRQGRTIMEGFSLYPTDRELLMKLMDYYGCSKSETFRTIVRAHAAQVGVK